MPSVPTRKFPPKSHLYPLLAIPVGLFILFISYPSHSPLPPPDFALHAARPRPDPFARQSAGNVSQERESVVCDPWSEPGMLFYPPSVEHRLRTNWLPFSPLCPPSPDYLLSVRSLNAAHTGKYTDFPRPVYPPSQDLSLDFLRNKTILILGDSVDRQSVEFFAPQVGEAFPRRFDYSDYNSQPKEGWDHRSVPHEVRVEKLGLSVVNGFFYGMDDVREFSYAADWHAPGSFEERLHELYVPMIRSMEENGRPSPSFISLHSGMWDLAFFGRRDKKFSLSLRRPLTEARTRWWSTRFRSSIRALKAAFPEAKIWVRGLHRVGDNWAASFDWSAGVDMANGGGFTNFFTDVRIAQLRALAKQVAREEGVPYFDFGEAWEGWQRYQDKVHPHPFPGGPIISQALMHHVWMEEMGRENWQVRDCQFIKGCGSMATGD